MYKYTAAKNQQANERLQKRQLSKQIFHNQANNKKTSKNSSKMVKKTIEKPTKELPKIEIPEWLIKVAQIGGSLLLAGVGLVVMLMIGVNSFLPQVFKIKQEKNLLLVNNTIDQGASHLYLVKLSPQTETANIFSLKGDSLVPIAGGYGQYPLGFLAPLLRFENNDLEKITAAYNFALKQAVDEVYFMPQLGELKDKKTVEQAIGKLIKNDFWRTTRLQKQWLEIYFYLKTAQFFSIKDFEFKNETQGLDIPFLAKEKLNGCPVVLVNSAGVNNLAQSHGQMLEANGFLVVNRENPIKKIEESVIYYDQNENDCQQLIGLAQKLLPRISKIVPDGGEQAKQYRAKMVINLGVDFAN